MKKYDEVIIEEICKECNFVERIVVKLLKRLALKIYNISREYIINNVAK